MNSIMITLKVNMGTITISYSQTQIIYSMKFKRMIQYIYG